MPQVSQADRVGSTRTDRHKSDKAFLSRDTRLGESTRMLLERFLPSLPPNNPRYHELADLLQQLP
jgi:hypothetical protein